MRTSASPAPWRATATLDRQVVATANATVPVLVGYGTFAMGVALLALVALATRRAAVAQRARFGLLMAAAALVALLAMGIWSPRSPWLYGFGMIGVSAVLACLATLVGPRLGVPPLGVLLVVTAAAVAIDALFGAPLVSHALLSGYYLPGIRFYGIGNEFSSLSIGAALVGFFLTPRPSFRSGNAGRGTRKAALLLWIAVVVATGVPAWGADAGGALSGTMTFAMAFLALQAGRLRARHVAIALAVGVAVTLTFALLDRLRPEEARSHVGAAVAAGQSRGPDALWEIVRNKVAMSLRLTATPGAAGALAGLGLIGWILFRGPLAGRVAAVLTARPDLRTVLAPAAWGALAATLFNDSGIIPALLLLTPPTAAVIDGLLCDSSQWITEPGASASPPATIWGGAPTR